jgi:hypothetical protein
MPTRSYILALIALGVIAAMGSTLDVMEVDPAQYASISRDLLHSNDWLQLHYRGRDYLDKPPLLFWLSALSFKLFGVHAWSYKLPSILFAFLGIYATLRFARLHHPLPVARTAALMFGGSAAWVLMTNDVRCDTILTGSVITAIWLGMAWLEQGRWWQLVGCAVAVAAGMLAKGPMGLMAPALALGGHVIATGRWRALLDARLLVVPLLIALLLLPMSIGLYEQHGTHGLKFYFWEQSFGRITGESRWKDDSPVFFFTHELLWQMLPWTVFVLLGLWHSGRALLRRMPWPEHASLLGALLVFLAISLSRFKLPHYLYVVLPLFAVMAARAWHAEGMQLPRRIHVAVLVLLWGLAVTVSIVAFPEGSIPFVLMLCAALIVLLLYRLRPDGSGGLFMASFWVMVAVAMSLNGHFYPNILRYQANAQAGRWAATVGLDKDHFYGMQVSGSALDFHAGFHVPWLSNAWEAQQVIAPGVTIYTDAERRQELLDAGLVPNETWQLQHYPVQLMGIDLLLPERRQQVLQDRYLLRY